MLLMSCKGLSQSTSSRFISTQSESENRKWWRTLSTFLTPRGVDLVAPVSAFKTLRAEITALLGKHDPAFALLVFSVKGLEFWNAPVSRNLVGRISNKHVTTPKFNKLEKP